MSTTTALALIELRDALAAYFTARGRQVEMVFGFGSRKLHAHAAARIAVEPGGGEGPRRALHNGLVNPLQVGEVNDDVFGQLNERFQLFLFAHDARAPADPAVQCLAVSILHDAVCEAIVGSGLDVTIDGADWVVSSEINQHGAGIVLRGYATRFMYTETLDRYREVTPWVALTHVYSDDEHVEDVTSPPQDPG